MPRQGTPSGAQYPQTGSQYSPLVLIDKDGTPEVSILMGRTEEPVFRSRVYIPNRPFISYCDFQCTLRLYEHINRPQHIDGLWSGEIVRLEWSRYMLGDYM